MMLDIDKFKRVNDRWGHDAGDAVLREAARRMQNTIRQYDSMGRYGGEEFLVILPGCDEHTTLERAERLRSYLSNEPLLLTESSVTLTASFGATTASPGEDSKPELLIRIADEALYRAKRLGRNRVEVTFERASASIQ